MEEFFLIAVFNGEVRVYRRDEQGIISLLSADEGTGELTEVPFAPGAIFDQDPMYWGGRCLIIKGTMVEAKPASVRYELR